MTERTPASHYLDDARLKAKLDPVARLEYARAEGRSQGLAEGLTKG